MPKPTPVTCRDGLSIYLALEECGVGDFFASWAASYLERGGSYDLIWDALRCRANISLQADTD